MSDLSQRLADFAQRNPAVTYQRFMALLAAAEEILPCCIDEWGRDAPDVEALIKAVKLAKGEPENRPDSR